MPEWRIIDDATWRAAHERFRTVVLRADGAGFRQRKKGRPQRYTLSGLTRCGCCGGAVTRVTADRYGCASFKNSGGTLCKDHTRAPLAVFESAFQQDIIPWLLSDESLDLAETITTEILEAEDKAARITQVKPNKVASRVTELQAEIAELRKSPNSRARAAAVAAVQAEIEQIERAAAQAAKRAVANVQKVFPHVREQYRALVLDGGINKLTGPRMVRAQAALLDLMGGPATLIRTAEGGLELDVGYNVKPLVDAALGRKIADNGEENPPL
jgi:hypothetical protein